MTSIMNYFSGCSKAPNSDRIILVPSSVLAENDVADDALTEPDEKLNGVQKVEEGVEGGEEEPCIMEEESTASEFDSFHRI